MTKYLQNKNGKLAGSIGDGVSAPSSGNPLAAEKPFYGSAQDIEDAMDRSGEDDTQWNDFSAEAAALNALQAAEDGGSEANRERLRKWDLAYASLASIPPAANKPIPNGKRGVAQDMADALGRSGEDFPTGLSAREEERISKEKAARLEAVRILESNQEALDLEAGGSGRTRSMLHLLEDDDWSGDGDCCGGDCGGSIGNRPCPNGFRGCLG